MGAEPIRVDLERKLTKWAQSTICTIRGSSLGHDDNNVICAAQIDYDPNARHYILGFFAKFLIVPGRG